MKRLAFIILITMLLCGSAWGQTTLTKQTAPQFVFLKLTWNGLGMSPLQSDTARWQLWHHYPTDTVFNSGRLRTLTSSNWIGLGNGLIAFRDTFAVSGPHVITVRDSVILGIVGTGDATAPVTAFTVNSNLPCDVTGWSVRWRNGKNRGKVFYVCTHDTSAGASVDSIVICESAGTWGAAAWANADSVKTNDTLEFSRIEEAFVVSVMDSAGGGGGGTDTVNIKLALIPPLADSMRRIESDSLPVKFVGSTVIRDTLDEWAKNDTIGFVTNAATGGITPTQVESVMAANHGSGSYLTATGFAVPGSAMTLTVAERQAVRDTNWTRPTRTLTNLNTDSVRNSVLALANAISESVWWGDVGNGPHWPCPGIDQSNFMLHSIFDTACGDAALTHNAFRQIWITHADTVGVVSTYSPSVGGSNNVRVNVLLSTDSTAIEDAIITAWTLDYGTERTYGVTSTGGFTTLTLPTDSIALQVQAWGYTSWFDTISVTAADTVTAYITALAIPSPPSPARCVVWGDVQNIDTSAVISIEVSAQLRGGTLPQYLDSVLITGERVYAVVDSNGRWSIPLIKGAQIWLEISTGYRGQGTVPDSVSANYRSFLSPR